MNQDGKDFRDGQDKKSKNNKELDRTFDRINTGRSINRGYTGSSVEKEGTISFGVKI